MVFRSIANSISARDVYPTVGTLESDGNFATSPGKSPESSSSAPSPVEQAAAVGAAGKPMAWWVALVVMLVALMYAAQKFGSDGEFSNLKLSAYNIFTISLAAIIGINLFKLVFTRFPVPGLSTVVLSA